MGFCANLKKNYFVLQNNCKNIKLTITLNSKLLKYVNTFPDELKDQEKTLHGFKENYFTSPLKKIGFSGIWKMLSKEIQKYENGQKYTTWFLCAKSLKYYLYNILVMCKD